MAFVMCLMACRLGFDQAGDDDSPKDGGMDSRDRDPDGGDDDDDDDDAGTDGATIACPGSYVVLQGAPAGSRYRIVDNSTAWTAAEAACEADGHHLAIPDDAAERDAIHASLPLENIWIGVTDRITTNVWRTVIGGVATLLPWDMDEPDDEDCVYIDSATMLYRTQDCGSGRRYVCECDGSPADGASY